MKVEPTKDIDKPRVRHNKVLFWIILVLIVLFIVLIIYMMSNWQKWEEDKDKDIGGEECVFDSDCVEAECCHASGCVSLENAPECSNLFCTDECAPNTLDCGQGECKCVNGKCEAVFVE